MFSQRVLFAEALDAQALECESRRSWYYRLPFMYHACPDLTVAPGAQPALIP